MKCPCNPSKLYTECCKKVHNNIQVATTAEMLMRSRYSAFVLANINYLQESHHSSRRPSKKEKKEILAWAKSVEWIKLELINSSENTVEFKAFFMDNGAINVMHENSLFVKENNCWFYKSAL